MLPDGEAFFVFKVAKAKFEVFYEQKMIIKR